MYPGTKWKKGTDSDGILIRDYWLVLNALAYQRKKKKYIG